MMLLLCPDCLSWREPEAGECPVCRCLLDMFAADPSRADIADAIGNWRECLGPFEVSRSLLPSEGTLHVSNKGLLFVPHVASVLSIDDLPDTPRSSTGKLWGLMRGWLNWACGRPRVRMNALKLPGTDAGSLADLLLSDPGVLFVSRASIATWRRHRRRWEFCRTDARWLPEAFTSRARDGGQRLQTWLEETACPLLPTNL